MLGTHLRTIFLGVFFLVSPFATGQAQTDTGEKNSVVTDLTKTDSQFPTQSPGAPLHRNNYIDNWGLLPPGTDPENRLFLPLGKQLVQDQKQFWTYPFHAQRGDVKYVSPFLAFTGALIASDSWMSKQVPDSPSQVKRSRDFSNYAVYSLVGG